MERHLLDPVGSASVADVVRRLGAVLSMDESLAELAVRTRSTTSRAGDLAQALADGSVIKAFAFRGSMHYLSPEDGGIYLALRSAGRQWELPSWVDYYRLAPSDWPDFRAAVREALSDGPLTVAELGDALTKHTRIPHLRAGLRRGRGHADQAADVAGGHELRPAADGQHTFQRLDTNPRWAGIPDLDDAGPRAVTAYLRTYGPATLEHVHYWLGNGLSAGRRRLDRWIGGLGDQLAAVDVEGTDGVRRARGRPVPARQRRRRRPCGSFPGHDQWVMGPGTKDVHVTPPPLRDAMTRKANPLIVGGVVRGTWTRKGDELTVSWLDERRRPDEAIEQEAARLAGLLGTDLHLRLATYAPHQPFRTRVPVPSPFSSSVPSPRAVRNCPEPPVTARTLCGGGAFTNE